MMDKRAGGCEGWQAGERTEGRTDGGVHNIPVAFINKYPKRATIAHLRNE